MRKKLAPIMVIFVVAFTVLVFSSSDARAVVAADSLQLKNSNSIFSERAYMPFTLGGGLIHTPASHSIIANPDSSSKNWWGVGVALSVYFLDFNLDNMLFGLSMSLLGGLGANSTSVSLSHILSPTVLYHPLLNSKFFVKLSIGRYEYQVFKGTETVVSNVGFGYRMGAGYHTLSNKEGIGAYFNLDFGQTFYSSEDVLSNSFGAGVIFAIE